MSKKYDDDYEMLPEYDFSKMKPAPERGHHYKQYWRRRGGRILSPELAERYTDDLCLHQALCDLMRVHGEEGEVAPPPPDPILTDEQRKPDWTEPEEFWENGQRMAQTRMIIKDRGPFREAGGRFLAPAFAERFADDVSLNEALQEYLRLKRESA